MLIPTEYFIVLWLLPVTVFIFIPLILASFWLCKLNVKRLGLWLRSLRTPTSG